MKTCLIPTLLLFLVLPYGAFTQREEVLIYRLLREKNHWVPDSSQLHSRPMGLSIVDSLMKSGISKPYESLEVGFNDGRDFPSLWLLREIGLKKRLRKHVIAITECTLNCCYQTYPAVTAFFYIEYAYPQEDRSAIQHCLKTVKKRYGPEKIGDDYTAIEWIEREGRLGIFVAFSETSEEFTLMDTIKKYIDNEQSNQTSH